MFIGPCRAAAYAGQAAFAGIDQVMTTIGSGLWETLTLVVSKSGDTKETRNVMLEVRNVYKSSGLDFTKHAVAVTGVNSQLDQHTYLILMSSTYELSSRLKFDKMYNSK